MAEPGKFSVVKPLVYLVLCGYLTIVVCELRGHKKRK